MHVRKRLHETDHGGMTTLLWADAIWRPNGNMIQLLKDKYSQSQCSLVGMLSNHVGTYNLPAHWVNGFHGSESAGKNTMRTER